MSTLLPPTATNDKAQEEPSSNRFLCVNEHDDTTNDANEFQLACFWSSSSAMRASRSPTRFSMSDPELWLGKRKLKANKNKKIRSRFPVQLSF